MSKGKVTKKMSTAKGYDIVKLRVRRFVAALIDWYIVSMIAAMPVTFYLREGDYLQGNAFQISTYGTKVGLLLAGFVIIVGLLYYYIIPTFIWKGQTLGKRICKVKVVKESGEEVTPIVMAIREILVVMLLEGGVVVTASYLRQIVALLMDQDVANVLKYIAYGITLLSIIYAYFQPLSQMFHDKIAKTLVIKN